MTIKKDRTDAEIYHYWRINILTWLAAVVTPMALQRSGLTWLVIACGLLIVYSLYEGIRAKFNNDNSTFLVRAAVPVVLAIAALAWAYRDRLFA